MLTGVGLKKNLHPHTTAFGLDSRQKQNVIDRVFAYGRPIVQFKEIRCTTFALKRNSITLVGSELVRSWFEPDSVMEFGF